MNNAPYLDVDFIREHFSKTILDDYQHALDFMLDQPDFSLLKFRKIIESLCETIIKQKNIEIEKGLSLQEKIDELDKQHILFQGSSKRTLHQARMLCNFGVHSLNNPIQHNTTEKDQKETIEKEKTEKAQEARKLIIQIFEDTYLVLNKGEKIQKFSRAPTGKQTYKELLFKVTTPSCNDKELLEAGNIYEILSAKYPLPNSRHDHYHSLKQNFLYNLAANCYKTSYKMSVDTYEFKYCNQVNPDDYILQRCQLEPLFKYASLASKKLLGKAQIKEGWKLMKIAADREHIEALVPYGKYCHEVQSDLSEAERYFTKAVKHDEPSAYSELAHFYKENDMHTSKIQPLLEKGVKLGDPNSMYQLGLMYQKGDIVEQDKEKSKILLRDAAENGSMEALLETLFSLPETKETMKYISNQVENQLKKIEHVLKERMTPKPITKGKKIGRNDPCPCNSGKKYKQCCIGGKEITPF